MYVILSIMVVFCLFYALGKYERRRRALFFRNVLNLFKIEEEIEVNSKTKLLLEKEESIGHFDKYSISVVFENITVEKRYYTENMNQDETIAFKGPWKKDIYNCLRRKHYFYSHFKTDNVLRFKSREALYKERYKRYIATRESLSN